MYPAHIESYYRPTTVAEALAAITRQPEGDSMFLAGGQSLMQAIKSRMVRPTSIVDLQSVAELRGIDQANGLRIGAMTRYVEIAEYEQFPAAYAALRDAAERVGDRQVRNRGTIGGSVCWNYVASCLPSVVLALNGTMSLASADGSIRDVKAKDFIIAPLETARREDEILLCVSWPKPPPKTGSAYKKWGLVTDALPVVGMCVSISLDDLGKCRTAQVAVAGLADGAQIADAGGAALIGSAGDEASISAAMNDVADSVETHSDHWADASYREQLIKRLGVEVTLRAFARARR
ncbi:MAG: FAD binding domain-containing protein [Proteobacteria bacterium]|nr:FAD binding domain-containing protein [Pseudomonadota bacterium]